MLSLLPMAAHAQGAASTTSLTSSSPTLQLPGSLTLTSVVAPPAGGGVPLGSVNFKYDGTNSLGTAPLIIVPSTQTFNTPINNPVTTTQVGTTPFGLFSMKSPAQPSPYPVLGLLDYDQVTPPASFPTYYPRLTIFSGKGTGLFQTSATYPLLTAGFSNYYSNSVDAFGVGDFNHDGIPDVLLHGTAANPYTTEGYFTTQYYVLLGKADGTFDATTPGASFSGPDESTSSGGSNPTTQLIAVDDFNGDGYSDVAYIENGIDYAATGNIGIVLNPGASTQVAGFGTFIAAPRVIPPTGIDPTSPFLASGITTGHFTLSGFTDVAVVGRFSVNQVAQAQGYVQLYHGHGDGTLTLYGAPIAVGNNPSAIVSGKFGQNQLADVVVANRSDGTVQLLANDGAGGLLPPQAGDTITVGTSPSALTVADFNSDGSPDILVTDGIDGSQRYLLNSQTGHLGTPVVIGTAPGLSTLAAAGDFNGDLLPDIATITRPSQGESSVAPTATADLYVNSASSQAVLTTAAQSLPVGAHTLTATFPGDLNFTTSTSTGVPVTVNQTPTTVSWTTPAAIEYGTPLSATQLNATASVAGTFVYNPAAGTILTPGVYQLSVSFTPSDAFDYATPAPANVNITVLAPTLTGIAPATAPLGSTATFIVQGQGFVSGAVVLWNGVALPTTLTDSHHLVAAIPAGAGVGTYTVTVSDPSEVIVTGSEVFSITGQQQLAASTTSLSTSNPSLVRPGSVTLTATVNQPPVAGGVPIGNVNFFYDGTNALGTAALTMIPGSETLPATPTASPTTSGTAPVGVAAVQRSRGARPVLVSADANTGDVAMYDLTTSFATPTQYLYHLADPAAYQRIDAVGTGYFLQPKSSGVQSFLVHAGSTLYSFGSYAVFTGSGSTGESGPTLAPPAKTSSSGCNCSNPDQEVITIDDYNGDGYSDVGALIPTLSFSSIASPRHSAAYPYGPAGAIVGVAVNDGQTSPGSFTTVPFFQAPLPANFCAIAIASGNFNTTGTLSSATGAQLAVLGATPASNNCTTLTATDPYNVYLYGLNASNVLVQVGSIATDAGATTIAAADINKDGKVDLVIGESSASGNGVRVAIGNGDGTFQAPLALVPTTGTPVALSTNDFSGDGYPDVAVTLAGPAGLAVLNYNSSTGNLAGPAQTYSLSATATGITAADLNLDGLADLAVAIPGNQQATINGSIDILLNSASSQATFVVTPEALSLGTHALTATFPGDINFAASTSGPVQQAVTQTPTALVWATPAPIEYGMPLGAAQLNATSSIAGTITYNPPAGTVLTPGLHTLTALFTPSQSADYGTATATVTLVVTAPSLTGISPATAKLGDPDTTITVTGQGLVRGAVVSWNGTPLVTTFVNLNQLTAVVPSALFANVGTYTITVADPNNIAVAGSQTFSVTTASTPIVTATAAATLTSGQQGTLTLAVSPYPAPITATLTISFAPLAPITVLDPMVRFANDGTTETVSIPANSTAAIPPIGIQAGSTAGTITVTITLKAGGVDVTPSTLLPVVIVVPAAPPVINTATITRSGRNLQIVVTGLSSTRDMVDAEFVFKPAAGKSISITHIIVNLNSAFTTWYSNPGSDQFGTTFTYTQPFTLDSPATDVAGATVTLTNSKGSSQPASVQ